jgi:DNA-nicking Smr family endonuclease
MASKKDVDDTDLFRAVMQDVKPLKRRAPCAGPLPSPSLKPALAKKDTPKTSPIRHQIAPLPSHHLRLKQSSICHGDIAGIDRRTGQRFKRGQLTVEASLDLHGLNQVEAHRELDGFLSRQYMTGKRCVIVITGKGVGKNGGGVLRAAVPRWLNESPNREKVLAFEYARQRDGGAGALYVLIKRRRMGG